MPDVAKPVASPRRRVSVKRWHARAGDLALLSALGSCAHSDSGPTHEPADGALQDYATVLHRCAVGDLNGDSLPDVALASGSDHYPQNLFVFPGCEESDVRIAGFRRGEQELDEPESVEPFDKTWVSPDFGYYTGVQIVRHADKTFVYASSLGDAIQTVEGRPSGGIVRYAVDSSQQAACNDTRGKPTVGRVETLLGCARVADFQVGDVLGDSGLELVAAFEVWAPDFCDTQDSDASEQQTESDRKRRPLLRLLPAPYDPGMGRKTPGREPRRPSSPGRAGDYSSKRQSPQSGQQSGSPSGVSVELHSASASDSCDDCVVIFSLGEKGLLEPKFVLKPSQRDDVTRVTPSRVRLLDANGDGEIDILAAFQAHSVTLVLGPLDSQESDSSTCEAFRMDGETFAPSTNARPAPETKPRVVCSQINEQFVSSVDWASYGANAGSVVVTTSWCDPSDQHTPKSCSAASRLIAWEYSDHKISPRVLASMGENGAQVTAVALYEACGEGACGLRAVYGIAEDGKASPTDRKSRWKLRRSVRQSRLQRMAISRPLSPESPPRKGYDFATGATGVALPVDVRAFGGVKKAVECSATKPIEGAGALYWCESGDGTMCNEIDAASRRAPRGAKHCFRTVNPDLLVLDAMPTNGVKRFRVVPKRPRQRPPKAKNEEKQPAK